MPMNTENTAAFHGRLEAAVRTNAGAVEKATDNPGEERELSDAQKCHSRYETHTSTLTCGKKLGHSGQHSFKWSD